MGFVSHVQKWWSLPGPNGGKQLRAQGMWLKKCLFQVCLIRMKMVQTKLRSQNFWEIRFANMRAEDTGPTTVDVTPACKPEDVRQLAEGRTTTNSRSDWLLITPFSRADIGDCHVDGAHWYDGHCCCDRGP